jgi:hypothetical protein
MSLLEQATALRMWANALDSDFGILHAQLADEGNGTEHNQARFDAAGLSDNSVIGQLESDLLGLIRRLEDHNEVASDAEAAVDEVDFTAIQGGFNRIAACLCALRMGLEAHPRQHLYDMNIIYYVIGNNHEDRDETRKTRKPAKEERPKTPKTP